MLRAVPCNAMLERNLLAYLDGAGLRAEPKGFLFRAALGTTGQPSERPMGQADAYRMIRRRAAADGIATLVGNHSFRANRHHRVAAQRRQARRRAVDGKP